MKNINDLLERFYHSLSGSEKAKAAVFEAVMDLTGISIKEDKISYKQGILKLELSPAAKNEIRLKEECIKKTLKERYSLPVSRILYL